MNKSTDINNCNMQNSELRKSFEQKEMNSWWYTTDDFHFIISQLDNKHTSKVKETNQNIYNTLWKIRATVNYNTSGLIEKLNSGSISSVDVQEDATAFIMWYSESVQWHGIRRLCEYGVYKDNNIISTWPIQYVWAYAQEEDHPEKRYKEIKVLSTEDNSVIFWVKSEKQLLIIKWNMENWEFITLEEYDLAEESRIKTKNELEETLNWSNWKDNIEKIKRSLFLRDECKHKNHIYCDKIFKTDKFAIFAITQSDRVFDPTTIAYALYIVWDNYPKPIIFKNRSSSKLWKERSLRFKFEHDNNTDIVSVETGISWTSSRVDLQELKLP